MVENMHVAMQREVGRERYKNSDDDNKKQKHQQKQSHSLTGRIPLGWLASGNPNRLFASKHWSFTFNQTYFHTG